MSAERVGYLWRGAGSILHGKIVYMVCQWGCVVLLARLASPADVGAWGLAIAVCGPIMMTTNAGVRVLVASDVADGARRSVDYFATRLATGLAGFGCIGVLSVVVYRELWVVMLGYGLWKLAEALGDISHGAMQRESAFVSIRNGLVMRSLLALGGFSVALLAFGGASHAAVGYGVLGGIGWLGWERSRHGSDWVAVASRDVLREVPAVLRAAVPLAAMLGAVAFTSNVPRVWLERTHGLDELGLFTAQAYAVVAAAMLVTPVGQAFLPDLARAARPGGGREHRALARRMLVRVVLAAVVLALVGVAVGLPVIGAVYGAMYADDALTWYVLMVGLVSTVVANMLGVLAHSVQAYWGATAVSWVALLAAVCSAWLLVPAWGAVGAAATLFASTTMGAAGYALVWWRHAPIADRTGR